MPKIIKNGKEYSGVPIEVVTAWAPTADPVQVKEPLMGNTDISNIGDGTVTGAIDTLNTGLNDSGEGYVKLPDGTLICYGETGQIFPDNLTGKTSGAIYYHEYSVSITFPVQFYSGLRVIVSRKDGRECSVSWVGYTNVGINEIDTIGGVQTLNNNNPVVFTYIAIGRWKA